MIRNVDAEHLVAPITTGRTSGKPRTTFVQAYSYGAKVYLVSIPGERALWLKRFT